MNWYRKILLASHDFVITKEIEEYVDEIAKHILEY